MTHIKYLIRKYQGLLGIVVGQGLILQGIFILFFLVPKKAPINMRGVEQNNQRNNKDKKEVKLMESLSSNIRKKLTKMRTQ